MLCCIGLFAGIIAGAYLGVPWAAYLTIPLGAAGGLLADITIFRAFERKRDAKEQQQCQPVIDQQCCTILGLGKKKEQVHATTSLAENH